MMYEPSLPALAATSTRLPLSLLLRLMNACCGVNGFEGDGSHRGVKVACRHAHRELTRFVSELHIRRNDSSYYNCDKQSSTAYCTHRFSSLTLPPKFMPLQSSESNAVVRAHDSMIGF